MGERAESDTSELMGMKGECGMTGNRKPENILLLESPGDYQFDEALAYLNRSESECLHQVEGHTVYKGLVMDGVTVLMAIGMDVEPDSLGDTVNLGVESGPYGGDAGLAFTGAGRKACEGKRAVTVRFLNGTPEEPVRSRAIAYVREWLDLNTNLREFYELSCPDPLLGPVVERYKGLRLIGVPSLFEALCWTVAGQQINLAFAYTLKKRLVEAYGTRVRHEGREFMLFPPPERIAGLANEELQALKFSRSKTETLIRIAGLIADGSLSKEKLLASGDFREAEQRLTSIRGIGPWTANYVMMRCLRNRDAFPAGDVGLHNAIRRRLGLPDKPTLSQVEEMGSRWSPWRAYATFYLWSSLTES